MNDLEPIDISVLINSEEFKRKMDEVVAALRASQQATDELTAAQDSNASSTKKIADATKDHTSAAGNNADAISQQTLAVEDLAASSDVLKTKLESETEAIRAIKDSTDELTASLDESNQATDQAAQVTADSTAAANENAAANAAQSQSVDDASAASEAFKKKLEGMVEELKNTKKSTEELSTSNKVIDNSTNKAAASTAKNTVATVANTAATEAQGLATEIAAAAQEELNAAMTANVIGAVVALLTTAVTVMYSYISGTDDATDSQNAFNASMLDTVDSLQDLADAYAAKYDIQLIDVENQLELAKASGKSREEIEKLEKAVVSLKKNSVGEKASFTSLGQNRAQLNQLATENTVRQEELKTARGVYDRSAKTDDDKKALEKSKSIADEAKKKYDLAFKYYKQRQDLDNDDKVRAAKAAQEQKKISDQKLKTQSANNKKSESEEKRHQAQLDALNKSVAAAMAGAENDSLTGKDKELAKIDQHYDSLLAKAKALNAPQETKDNIEKARTLEKTNEDDRADLEAYKKTIEQQKEYFDELESYKKEIGEQSADALLNYQLNGQKSYIEALKRELDKIKDDKTPGAALKRNYLNTELTTAQNKDAENARKIQEQLIKDTQTYEEKRAAIHNKYADKLNELDNIKGIQNLQERKDLLNRQQDAELNALQHEQEVKSGAYKEMELLTAGYTQRELQILLDAAKKRMALSSSLSETQKKDLQAQIDNLQQAITVAPKGTKRQGTGIVGLINLVKQIKDLSSTRDSIKKQLEIPGQTTEKYAQLTSQLTTVSNKMSDGEQESQRFAEALSSAAQEAAGMFNMAAEALTGIDDGLADTFESLGEVAGAIGNIANGVSTGMAVGGPAGAAVGGAIAAVTSIVSIWGKAKQATAQAKKEVQAYYDAVEKGELNLQAKQRADKLAAIRRQKGYGELDAEKKELEQQTKDIQAAYDKLYNTLQGEQYVSDKKRVKKGIFGIGGSKAVDVMSSLKGTTYEELEELYSEGKLKDKAKTDFEALQKLKDELDAIGLSFDDLAERYKEIWTGTTADDISSTIIEGLEGGKMAVNEYAGDIEKILQKAVLNSIQRNALEKPIQQIYDQFAQTFSGDRMPTASELDSIRQQLNTQVGNAINQYQEFSKLLDVDKLNAATTDSTLSGQVMQLTEQTGTELAGITRGQYDEVIRQTDILYQQANSLAKIELNTAGTVTQLKTACEILIRIQSNTKPASTARDNGY